MSGEPEVEEHTKLGAQLAPVPPDEVPGLLGLRYLSADEKAQYEADAGLIRAIAPLAPYTRAVAAVRDLGDIVEALEAEPSARMRKRLGTAFRAVAHAMAEVPTARVVDGSQAEACAEAIRRLESNEAFCRVLALQQRTGDEPSREAAQGHLAVVYEALEACARFFASWLLAQLETIDAASRRIARLAGEVIEGAPAVITLQVRRRNEGGEPDVLGMVPDPLPLSDIQNLQAALRKAEDVLSEEPREPAMRGARAMYAEQVAATVAISEGELTNRDDGAMPDASGRALDFDALIAHLNHGVVRLEMAWSRALEGEDVVSLVGEWISFLRAMVGEVAHADRHLDAAEAQFELPVPEDEVIALPLDGNDASRRIAEAIVAAWIARSVDFLRQPTSVARDASGRAVGFFSSGAFARLRDQLTLLADLRSQTSVRRPPALVSGAVLRGDPEASVLHAAAVLRRRGPWTAPRSVDKV
jgi:hypothetical protein